MMNEQELTIMLGKVSVERERERELFARYAREGNFDVVAYVNAIGIDLIENAELNKISGFVAIRDGRGIICVNATDCPKRKRFTIAHELGHYYLHRDMLQKAGHVDFLYRNPNAALTDEERARECEANNFAAELLMPKEEFTELWHDKSQQISDMSDYFNVSESAIMVRAKKLHLSDVEEYY